MSSITLTELLDVVGKLDDSPGENSARERFRRRIKSKLIDTGQVRDYVEECLRVSGEQYSRALQDLVNHIGCFLGFDVIFGRYQGVKGEIGFDGYWSSPTGFHIVIEVKTTEVYSIRSTTLIGYIDQLISDEKISGWDNALGLYVIGKPYPDIRQLEHMIVAEKRINQLRIISVESLLTLAEMVNQYDVTHESILAILKPSSPMIDHIVSLMARLTAQSKAVVVIEEPIIPGQQGEPDIVKTNTETSESYWLTSVTSDENETAEDCIQTIVGQDGIYAIGERTPGRKRIKSGDYICFYATGKGVVAHARVKSPPERRTHPHVDLPWVFNLEQAKLYLQEPVVLDSEKRSSLDAFQGKDPRKPWAWFVQATRQITKHDFESLIRT
ncbi:MAG: EVE domain-containing protein [Armatimonadota bacterium]